MESFSVCCCCCAAASYGSNSVSLLSTGKKRKRDKQMYSVWVHVIQATGLKLKRSDRYINPVGPR